VRYTGPITERAEVMIYALGEIAGDHLVDYGWIVNADSGEIIWQMTAANSEYAGGDTRNVKATETLWLEPGRYELHYRSNSRHSYGDWIGAPPERELFWGIVVFNLETIARIKKQLAAAEMPVD